MHNLSWCVYLLLWNIRASLAWPELMAGGMKLGIQGQIYSFTTDLCSGGVFFKEPVVLDMVCIHGYFIRRPNGCTANSSTVIAGQNYVCINHDRSSSSRSQVQAFIPVTTPEYPLEHTIAFYDDRDTLKNLRRFAFMKAMRGMYSGRETGAVGAVVSNTHHTPDTSIGTLCYQGWPDTSGSAVVVEFPQRLSGGDSNGFFKRKCNRGTVPFPMRRASHFNFTEGFSPEERFAHETEATLPELFPEDEMDEEDQGQKQSAVEDENLVDDGDHSGSSILLDFPDASDEKLSNETASLRDATEAENGGKDTSADRHSYEDSSREPDDESNSHEKSPNNLNDTNYGDEMGQNGDEEVIVIDFADDDKAGNRENELNEEIAPGAGAATLAGNDSLSRSEKPDLNPAEGPGGTLNNEIKLQDEQPPTINPLIVDTSPAILFPGGGVGKPAGTGSEYPTILESANLKSSKSAGMGSKELLLNSPLKLKIPTETILSRDLMNWDPYIEEAVILAKYAILRDMNHTSGFDFESGKVTDSESILGLREQSHAKWFHIVRAASQVVKAQAPDQLLPLKFIDDAIELMGYLFRNLGDVDELHEDAFSRIMASLKACAGESKNIVASGIGCPPKFREVFIETKDGRNESFDLLKLPPAANSFRDEDVVVATAWGVTDFVLSACYNAFAPGSVNEHARLYVFMKATFRHERIQKRWFGAFSRVDAYAGLLPYGNHRVLLYNLDKLRAASRVNSLYCDWVPKPQMIVADLSGANIYHVGPDEGHPQSHLSVGSSYQRIGDDLSFMTGIEAIEYTNPLKGRTSKHTGVRWRVKRQTNFVVESKRSQKPSPGSPSHERPEWKKYEIWDGMAYCLQANYEIVGKDQLEMRGITPSIEELGHLCKA